jgi:hypothetical protein
MTNFRRAIGEVLLASRAKIIDHSELEDLLQSLLESERTHHVAQRVLRESSRDVETEYHASQPHKPRGKVLVGHSRDILSMLERLSPACIAALEAFDQQPETPGANRLPAFAGVYVG